MRLSCFGGTLLTTYMTTGYNNPEDHSPISYYFFFFFFFFFFYFKDTGRRPVSDFKRMCFPI
jgi:hypothetical protein